MFAWFCDISLKRRGSASVSDPATIATSLARLTCGTRLLPPYACTRRPSAPAASRRDRDAAGANITFANRPSANAVASDDQPAAPNVTTTGSLRRQASASP